VWWSKWCSGRVPEKGPVESRSEEGEEVTRVDGQVTGKVLETGRWSPRSPRWSCVHACMLRMAVTLYVRNLHFVSLGIAELPTFLLSLWLRP
jgi:hypothetical protein